MLLTGARQKCVCAKRRVICCQDFLVRQRARAHEKKTSEEKKPIAKTKAAGVYPPPLLRRSFCRIGQAQLKGRRRIK